jgi:hypothetical protein
LAPFWEVLRQSRLLAAKDLDHGFIFATPHPTLEDFLPPNHGIFSTDAVNPGVFRVGATDALNPADIHFPDVDAFPSVVQSCYLLSLVLNYMKTNTHPLRTKEEEFLILDNTIQTFGQSLLRQAEGSPLRGHYCTPFFLSIVLVS